MAPGDSTMLPYVNRSQIVKKRLLLLLFLLLLLLFLLLLFLLLFLLLLLLLLLHFVTFCSSTVVGKSYAKVVSWNSAQGWIACGGESGLLKAPKVAMQELVACGGMFEKGFFPKQVHLWGSSCLHDVFFDLVDLLALFILVYAGIILKN